MAIKANSIASTVETVDKNLSSAKVDEQQAWDLFLILSNNNQIFDKFLMPTIKNLTKKVKKDVFNRELAIKAFFNVVNNALNDENFTRMFTYDKSIVNVPTRYKTAEFLLEHYNEKISNLSYDDNNISEDYNVIDTLQPEDKENKRPYTKDELYDFLVKLINIEKESVDADDYKKLVKDRKDRGIKLSHSIEDIKNYFKEFKYDVVEDSVKIKENLEGLEINDTFENAGDTWTILDTYNDYVLVKSETKKYFPYVVAWKLDKEKDGTYTWAQGHYFNDETSAKEFLLNKIEEDNKVSESLDYWKEVETKRVLGSDGFWTDYTWYKNEDGSKHIFMFGDKEMTEPDEDYADWIEDSEKTADEWFKNYDIEEESSEGISNAANIGKIAEYYTEDKPNIYTIWSSSDINPNVNFPLINVIVGEDGKLTSEIIPDNGLPVEFNEETKKTVDGSIRSSEASGKSLKDALLRIDKSLNHADPFFSVEFDRNITNNGYELIAAQALRTLRDDLKAVVYKKGATEDSIVDAYKELTGVDYYTDEVIDRDTYNLILGLQLKPTDDKYEYENPKDNLYMQKLKDLAEDLIEKVNLKNNPDFYKE